MRKISEIKGEDALDVLADIIDEIAVICTDKDFVNVIENDTQLNVVKYLMKNHKKEILKVLAVLDGCDPATYKPSLVEIPAMLIRLLNDPAISSLFRSEGSVTSSGSVTESTEETENK